MLIHGPINMVNSEMQAPFHIYPWPKATIEDDMMGSYSESNME
jgi:hypothetical protein